MANNESGAQDQIPTNQSSQVSWSQFIAERADQIPASAKVILNSPDVPVAGRGERGPGLWLHSPAHAELFAATHRMLLAAAKLRKMDVSEIEWVRAARLEDSDLTFIFPTTDLDPNRIPLVEFSGHKWANLRTLLEPAKRLITVGYRERFAAHLVPDSPVGPAVVFDLARTLERKQEPKSKKNDETDSAKKSTSDAQQPAAKTQQPAAQNPPQAKTGSAQ